MFDPQKALLNLLQPGAASQTVFPPTSRYHGIPTSTIMSPNGVEDIYLRRRFLPALDRTRPLQQHNVTQGERLDLISFEHLADPEQFWRIADVNTEMDAAKLAEKSSRKLRIPLEGSL